MNLKQAREQDELRKVLSQTAYSYLKEKETVASTIEKLTELNNNADTPLEQSEIEQLVKEKASKNPVKDDTAIEATYIETSEYIYEQTVRTINDTKPILRIIANGANSANSCVDTMFVKYNLSNDTWEDTKEVTIYNNKYIPTDSRLFDDDNTVLIFPSGCLEYGDDHQLILDIREFIHDYLEVDNFYEQILPYYALFTWIQDRFPFTAYLHFVGVTSTGKSRAIDTMAQVCYKSIVASGSVTNSPIFRLTDMIRGTLCLNEFELGAKTEEGYNEKLQILKSGSEHYAALRTEGDKKKEVTKYILKGPKIFGGQRPIEDSALLSRTIVVPMKRKTRRLPIYTLKKFNQRGEELRQKLLLWRLRHLNKVNLEDIEYGVPELEKFDSRIQQIITPIFYLASPEVRSTMLEYLTNLEEDIKESRRDEISGKVFLEIRDKFSKGVTPILKEVASVICQTPEKTRGVIVKELSLNIEQQGHNNIRYVKWDEQQMKQLSNHFGVEFLPKPQQEGLI